MALKTFFCPSIPNDTQSNKKMVRASGVPQAKFVRENIEVQI